MKLKYDKTLSSFAVGFNLCRFTMVRVVFNGQVLRVAGRGLHSSTFRLNVSALSGIGVHFGVV